MASTDSPGRRGHRGSGGEASASRGVAVLALLAAAVIPAAALAGGEAPLVPTSSRPAAVAVSPPLASLPPAPGGGRWGSCPPVLRHGRFAGSTDGTSVEEGDRPLPSAGPVPSAMPSPSRNFAGLSNPGAGGWIPPDPAGDAGPNHYVQAVNMQVAVYDRSGNLASGFPKSLDDFFAPLGAPCGTSGTGQPTVLHDHLADRWLVGQATFTTNGPFHQCLAVSQTPDPTGAWFLYDFPYSATEYCDRIAIALWPDAFVGSCGRFRAPSFYWAGQAVIAWERERMLAGDPEAQQVDFNLYGVDPNFGGQAPSDLEGPPPPPGSPAYVVELDAPSFHLGSGLRIWELRPDWGTPSHSTLGLSGQPNRTLPVATFDWLCLSTRECLPQSGTTARLDAVSGEIMPHARYRNFGTHESLVLDATVKGSSTSHAALRWYEIRNPGSASPTVAHEGTWSPDAQSRWLGSPALDGDGNLAIGYSRTSSTAFPSLAWAGRLATDPAGTLGQGEATVQAGGGAQTSVYSYWGSRSALRVDPTDDCTFWYTGEYYPATSTSDWATRVASVRFPSCVSLLASPPSARACPGIDSVQTTVTLDPLFFTGTTHLSVPGCPTGATCTFSPNPVLAPSGGAPATSTLVVSGVGALAPGNWNVSFTATDSVDPAKSRTRFFAIEKVGVPGSASPAGPADGAVDVPLSPTLSWGPAQNASTYTVQVSRAPSFFTLAWEATLSDRSIVVSPALAENTLYYWRVFADNACGDSAAGPTFRFRTLRHGTVSSSCASPALAIPDNQPAGVTTTREVSGIGPVVDLDVLLAVTHSWVGELVFEVRSPGGTPTAVRIVDRPGVPASSSGCSGNDIAATLDDEATAGPAESQCATTPPALSGRFTPSNPLSAFDGLAADGTWTLFASDLASGDTGTVTSWCLDFTVLDPPTVATEPSSGTINPLRLSENGAAVDLVFQDVDALDYNVHVSNAPPTAGLFDVDPPDGQRVCNVVSVPSGIVRVTRKVTAFALSVANDTGTLFYLVSADNGLPGSESRLGSDSVGSPIVPSSSCPP